MAPQTVTEEERDVMDSGRWLVILSIVVVAELLASFRA